MTDHPSDPAGNRMDRRTLIKAAAIAGAGAWAAPVIIDSLSSPAAALTLEGDFLFTFLVTYNTAGCTAALQGPACTVPSSPSNCQTQDPGAKPVYPGDAAESLVSAAFSDCAGLNQGICWTTTQGAFTWGGLTPDVCNASSTFGCFVALHTCGASDPSNAEIPNTLGTVNNGTQWVVQLVVQI